MTLNKKQKRTARKMFLPLIALAMMTTAMIIGTASSVRPAAVSR
ncbi:MAG TPA: hypothetical protein VGM90_13395 [Kofleriaceae bacterium]|jgi:hypothetical protein